MTRDAILVQLRAGAHIRFWPENRSAWLDGDRVPVPWRNFDEDERRVVKLMIDAGELVPVAAFGDAPAYRLAR